jgi:pimeloyl-ACP methyl ester carboxylesterase
VRRALVLLALLPACASQPIAQPPPAPTTTTSPSASVAPAESTPASSFEGSTPSADGVSIHYRSDGGVSDSAVVLVHCWGCNAHYWDGAIAVMSPHVRVVSLDLAGHGSSGKNRTNWTVRAFAEDVRAVADKLGLKKIVLVGHSMGGPIVLETAQLLGERVVAIVPIDTLKDVTLKQTPEENAKFFSNMRDNFADVTTKVVKSLFAPETDPKVADAILADELKQDPTIAVPILQASFTYPSSDALTHIHVPVHAIESDLSRTHLETNRQYAPQFEASVITKVGHWPMLEAKDRFAAMLDDSVTPPLDPTYVEGFTPSSDGTQIHYRAIGQGEPAVVFVHGWCGSTHVWDEQMRKLAPKHRVIALDLAGMGASQATRKTWTVASFADDVRAVIAKVGARRVVLVGHSMSGAIIVEAAQSMSGLAALVPVDTLQDVSHSFPPDQRDKFFASFDDGYPGRQAMFLKSLYGASSDPFVIDRIVAEAAQVPKDPAVPILRSAFDYALTDALSKVKLPIHAINGDKEKTALDANRKYAPQFDATILAGIGHWPMLEAPEKFDQALATILDALPPE